MSESPHESMGRDALLVLGIYGLLIVTLALGVADIISIRRLLLALHVALRMGKWWLGFVDKMGIIVLGLACLVFVLMAESWYRRLAASGWRPLLKRFAWVSAGQVAIILLGWLGG